MKTIKLSLPIYYKLDRKKPKITKIKTKNGFKIKTSYSSIHLVGLNWIHNLNPFTYNRVKEYYHNLVLESLESSNIIFEGKYSTEYKYCYKSDSSDAGNVISVIEKFSLDGLKNCGVIKDDCVKYHIESNGWTVEKDKNNPRLEITIKEIE